MAYADRIGRESLAFRKANRLKPYGAQATPAHWQLRYESYLAGVCDERGRAADAAAEAKAAKMQTASTPARRSGRTYAMIRDLPVTVRVIVVHTAQMKDYIEHMLREVRPDLFQGNAAAAAPVVRVVTSTQGCDRLRGIRIAVDHEALETATPQVRDLLRSMQRPALDQDRWTSSPNRSQALWDDGASGGKR